MNMRGDPGVEINKWCESHWTLLREAVESRGMAHLIPKGSEAAAAQLADEIKVGTARDAEGFDPLMRARWAISARVMEQGGNPLDCPLCQIQRHEDTCTNAKCRQMTAGEMIASCTDSLREYVKSKGLLR